MKARAISLNLHSYDKQMRSTIDHIRALPKPNIDLKSIKDLGPVEDVWKILVEDHEHDPINDVRVDELLPFIGKMLLDGSEDFRRAMLEQFSDMRAGFCQQGRTIRLCQLIMMYYPDINSI